MTLFYFTRGVIPSPIIRFAISAAIFIILSITTVIVIVSKGDPPPPSSKSVDFEEMEKARKKIYGDDK